MKTILRWVLFVPVNLAEILAGEVLAICDDIGAWLNGGKKP